MFEQLQHPQVQLMLTLSRENRPDRAALGSALAQTDLQALFDLCREHELDGVVASHILEDQLIPLPEQWQQAYAAEKAHLGFLKDTAARICRIMAETWLEECDFDAVRGTEAFRRIQKSLE